MEFGSPTFEHDRVATRGYPWSLLRKLLTEGTTPPLFPLISRNYTISRPKRARRPHPSFAAAADSDDSLTPDLINQGPLGYLASELNVILINLP